MGEALPADLRSLSPSVVERQYSYAEQENGWPYYDYTDEPEMHRLVVEMLPLGGDETIVDIGCGDGRVLSQFRNLRGHRGQLIGIDRYPEKSAMTWREAIRRRGLFLVGEAEVVQPNSHVTIIADGLAAGLRDESADVVLELFSTYHLLPVKAALQEVQRILKPGGRAVFATSGEGNKAYHRHIERAVAAGLSDLLSTQLSQRMTIKPPPVFAQSCDDKVLADLLPQFFPVVEHTIDQCTVTRIPRDRIDVVINSLQVYGVGL